MEYAINHMNYSFEMFRMCPTCLSPQNKHLGVPVGSPGQWLLVLWPPMKEVNWNLKSSN